MNQHEQGRLKNALERIPSVKEKTKLAHPFSYIGKSSHTLYVRNLRELDQQEQFQTGSDSSGTALLHCRMRLDTQQHPRDQKCQYHKPLLTDFAGQLQDLDYPAASVAAQSCAWLCDLTSCV